MADLADHDSESDVTGVAARAVSLSRREFHRVRSAESNNWWKIMAITWGNLINSKVLRQRCTDLKRKLRASEQKCKDLKKELKQALIDAVENQKYLMTQDQNILDALPQAALKRRRNDLVTCSRESLEKLTLTPPPKSADSKGRVPMSKKEDNREAACLVRRLFIRGRADRCSTCATRFQYDFVRSLELGCPHQTRRINGSAAQSQCRTN